MTTSSQIATGATQITELMAGMTDAERASATPCTEWTVADLTDHLVHTAATW
ncbi:maleylpyruvate isomerase N-terminal domain-containing protein [Rhodococcus fascians]|nr:maleylpyruvate isomerase N-terminal domain-containing protein [Rhodococcus fascians]MBY4139165.1 maleylpyruvate isomerase N-terminal domain-containing protein [Rhodococcus fascians]MBY4217632.1 maleylpyruvate isomerase N-terminal domain-containing protein [Rhodococcus fascians]MBY4224630.1 maleylpyruvate isomerase N-terminal domain-containing protein [Rhodococcus fascians]MBY4233780.1 maleylpyruvate isomerase N-terminal domain-containing protein [Rhodococcus fascians]